MDMLRVPSFNNALWRKGTRTTAASNCVEVATSNRLVGIRDSKNPTGPIVIVRPAEWTNFLTTIQTLR
jgi:Domain of unknown function (DUF397)